MTLRIDDHLAEIIDTDKISDRIDSFVWISLIQKHEHLKTLNFSTNRFELRKILAEHLRYDSAEANKIKHAIKYSLIPEDELRWINDNKWQIYSLKKYIFTAIEKNHLPPTPNSFFLQPPKPPPPTSFLIPEFLTGRNRGIAIFDFWAINFLSNFNYSIYQSKMMHATWSSQMEIDKKFDWFNDKDGASKRNIFQILLTKKFSITYNPLIIDHDDFLIHLDGLNISNFEKEAINKKTRDRWNQQKRRELNKDTEKQCNFNLPIVIDDKLTKLAKKYDLSRSDIINILIRSEAQQESYIKAWLQRKPSNYPVE